MSVRKDSKEVRDFAACFHYGTLGIAKTTHDLRADLEKVLASGYSFKAYNVEMIHAELTREILAGRMRLHVPTSYPLGNFTLYKKQIDLEHCVKLGVDESCVCLNYGAIVSHRYDLVEEEVRVLVRDFEGPLELAFVIQASLLNDGEIIDVCRAIGNGGGIRIKLNTGYGWGTSPEEVALIRRVFGYAFDLHPSGNIKTLEQVDQLLALGVNNIHSLAAFEIIDQYVERRNRGIEVRM